MNRRQRRAWWAARHRDDAPAAAPGAAPGAAVPAPAALRVHVQEVVLHGLAVGERWRIGDALGGELGRLIAEGGLPPIARGATARLDAGAVPLAAGAGGAAVGREIAGAVYGGMGR